MSHVLNFSSFSRLFESSFTGDSILVGDSLIPLLDKHVKDASALSQQQGESSLWKSGMGVSWLKSAIQAYPISPSIKNVVISIGSNGGFNLRDDIKGLFTALKSKFPNAKFFVVQGSWGWGGNKSITLPQVEKYYSKFSDEGAIVINPPIGFSPTDREAHSDRPVLAQIGKILDGLISERGGTATSFQTAPTIVSGTKPIVQQETGIIYRPGDPYRYKVVNDHWLAKRDDQARWFEITGGDFKDPFQSSIDKLDRENPNARSKNAPKRNVSGGAISVQAVTADNVYKKGSSGYDAILVGGLDYRSGDYKIDEQVELLKEGFGKDKKVMGFRYNAPISEILGFLKQNPFIPIFLFSAGCEQAETLSKDPNVNKSSLYIIEPYGASKNTTQIVRNAVENGVPAQNVFIGKSAETGLGIVSGATPTNSSSHWKALTKVGSLKSSPGSKFSESQGADPEKLDPKISETFNFHLIPDGKGTNYRSAQFPIDIMREMYQKYGIKNVIRFNGDGIDGRHTEKYKSVSIKEEEELAKSLGINFYKLSSTRNQDKVNELLQKGNTLVHCAHGADRTGGNVGGYFYATKINPNLTTPEQIWNYTTKYNGWERMSVKSPKAFSNGYLQQAQKFGVRDLQHAQELARK